MPPPPICLTSDERVETWLFLLPEKAPAAVTAFLIMPQLGWVGLSLDMDDSHCYCRICRLRYRTPFIAVAWVYVCAPALGLLGGLLV